MALFDGSDRSAFLPRRGAPMGAWVIPEPRPATVGIHEVLTAWRAAERELAATPEGSPELPRAQAMVTSLRAAYHQLFEEVRARCQDAAARGRDLDGSASAGGDPLTEAG